MKTYSELRNGKEITLELPLRVNNGTTRKGKVRKLHLAPSLNKIINLSKNYRVWATYKKTAEDRIKMEISRQTTEKFDKPVAVTFQRYCVRPLDWDNMGSSFKFIGDSIVELGIIKDDDIKHIVKYFPEQYKVAHYDDEKIIIKIFEWEV